MDATHRCLVFHVVGSVILQQGTGTGTANAILVSGLLDPQSSLGHAMHSVARAHCRQRQKEEALKSHIPQSSTSNKRDEERDIPTIPGMALSVRQFVIDIDDIDMAGYVHLPGASSVGDAEEVHSTGKFCILDSVWYQPASVFGRGTCFEAVAERPGSA
ncbi:hypothetical protein THAOC_03963 [Thalassiosira oceanica]|uniref:Uncharacterized protein n=1 Tax=Thalassiosira oceanica TaxID=159749 RepID=K0TK58_THAOC|nr:hypothetical protein THAOC_03963 [Thalassiosira oceanica]|eukprot:EJK74366.1 hypothetical protein THAOC_03963 [Thalassiosira oceanica]